MHILIIYMSRSIYCLKGHLQETGEVREEALQLAECAMMVTSSH